MENNQVQINGKWQQAKQLPYIQAWTSKIFCSFGFHELNQSNKYANTKTCFKCGKRKYNRKFDY